MPSATAHLASIAGIRLLGRMSPCDYSAPTLTPGYNPTRTIDWDRAASTAARRLSHGCHWQCPHLSKLK